MQPYLSCKLPYNEGLDDKVLAWGHTEPVQDGMLVPDDMLAQEGGMGLEHKALVDGMEALQIELLQIIQLSQ